MSIPQPYVPQQSKLITKDGHVSDDWNRSYVQPSLQTLIALSTTVLSGPDADPNLIVIGSPGYLYRQIGDATATLWFKTSGQDTDSGWTQIV